LYTVQPVHCMFYFWLKLFLWENIYHCKTSDDGLYFLIFSGILKSDVNSGGPLESMHPS
jgi:hypothetical protein